MVQSAGCSKIIDFNPWPHIAVVLNLKHLQAVCNFYFIYFLLQQYKAQQTVLKVVIHLLTGWSVEWKFNADFKNSKAMSTWT